VGGASGRERQAPLSRRGIHVRRSPLYLSQILKWADAHHKRTGDWPRMDSDRVAGVIDETVAHADYRAIAMSSDVSRSTVLRG
jgi:hypothetical protein